MHIVGSQVNETSSSVKIPWSVFRDKIFAHSIAKRLFKLPVLAFFTYDELHFKIILYMLTNRCMT